MGGREDFTRNTPRAKRDGGRVKKGGLMRRVITLGVTGGPATGKSLVSAELSRLGAALIDADLVAREVLAPGTPVFREVVRAFGPTVLRADGSLDREALAGIVFSDYGRLKELTSLTHPEILRIIRARMDGLEKNGGARVIVVDAPLLFESGLDRDVDSVVVVFTDEAVEVERLMARSGLDEAGALRVIGSQMPLEEKKRRADFLIDNNGPMEETLRQVREIYEKVLSRLPGEEP